MIKLIMQLWFDVNLMLLIRMHNTKNRKIILSAFDGFDNAAHILRERITSKTRLCMDGNGHTVALLTWQLLQPIAWQGVRMQNGEFDARPKLFVWLRMRNSHNIVYTLHTTHSSAIVFHHLRWFPFNAAFCRTILMCVCSVIAVFY